MPSANSRIARLHLPETLRFRKRDNSRVACTRVRRWNTPVSRLDRRLNHGHHTVPQGSFMSLIRLHWRVALT